MGYYDKHPMTPHEKRIWDAFANGGWLTRNDVGAALQRTNLNPHDTGLLERMVDEGLLEKRVVASGITKRFEYRAVGT